MHLHAQRVLISGVGSGIGGFQLAKQLSTPWCAVTICGREAAKLYTRSSWSPSCAVRALQAGRHEIKVGRARALGIIARITPGGALKVVNE